MRRHLLEAELALPILWIWLAIVVAVVSGYWLVRWWRRRHPPQPQEPELPYARLLQRRLDERRAAAKRARHTQASPPKGSRRR